MKKGYTGGVAQVSCCVGGMCSCIGAGSTRNTSSPAFMLLCLASLFYRMFPYSSIAEYKINPTSKRRVGLYTFRARWEVVFLAEYAHGTVRLNQLCLQGIYICLAFFRLHISSTPQNIKSHNSLFPCQMYNYSNICI